MEYLCYNLEATIPKTVDVAIKQQKLWRGATELQCPCKV